jgi:hypothetical protein
MNERTADFGLAKGLTTALIRLAERIYIPNLGY